MTDSAPDQSPADEPEILTREQARQLLAQYADIGMPKEQEVKLLSYLDHLESRTPPPSPPMTDGDFRNVAWETLKAKGWPARELAVEYLVPVIASAWHDGYGRCQPALEGKGALPRPWPVGALYYIWDTENGRGCRVALDEDLWASVDSLPAERRAALMGKLDPGRDRLTRELASSKAALDESRRIEKNLVEDNDAVRAELAEARARLDSDDALIALLKDQLVHEQKELEAARAQAAKTDRVVAAASAFMADDENRVWPLLEALREYNGLESLQPAAKAEQPKPSVTAEAASDGRAYAHAATYRIEPYPEAAKADPEPPAQPSFVESVAKVAASLPTNAEDERAIDEVMARREVVTRPLAQPVCSGCNDTHHSVLSGHLCTSCPVPCEECRSRGPGGPGAYCAKTPCACACHKTSATGGKCETCKHDAHEGRECHAHVGVQFSGQWCACQGAASKSMSASSSVAPTREAGEVHATADSDGLMYPPAKQADGVAAATTEEEAGTIPTECDCEPGIYLNDCPVHGKATAAKAQDQPSEHEFANGDRCVRCGAFRATKLPCYGSQEARFDDIRRRQGDGRPDLDIVRHLKGCAGSPCDCPRHDPLEGDGAKLLAEFKARSRRVEEAADAVREQKASELRAKGQGQPSELLTDDERLSRIVTVRNSLYRLGISGVLTERQIGSVIDDLAERDLTREESPRSAVVAGIVNTMAVADALGWDKEAWTDEAVLAGVRAARAEADMLRRQKREDPDRSDLLTRAILVDNWQEAVSLLVRALRGRT